MLELRASGMAGRTTLLSVARPVHVPPGTFLPQPDRPAPGIVLAIHPLDQGRLEAPATIASRSYLSQGLAAPDGVLSPVGWLLDVVA